MAARPIVAAALRGALGESVRITSVSTLGRTQINILFNLNRNIDGAALDVQTALTVAQRRLPIEMTVPPSFRKVNPGEAPVVLISAASGQNVARLIPLIEQVADERRKRIGTGEMNRFLSHIDFERASVPAFRPQLAAAE